MARFEHLAAEDLRLPTQDELPYSDGIPLESQQHFFQIFLLIETLKIHWEGRDDFFVGGNMFFYFTPEQLKKNDFVGPDLFVALGVKSKGPRKSWVSWEEGKYPELVIELMAEETTAFDRDGKKQIYCEQMRVPEYFYCDPFSDEFAGFRLRGNAYVPIEPMLEANGHPRFDCQAIGLGLTRHKSEYLGVTADWLRWTTPDGKLLPTK